MYRYPSTSNSFIFQKNIDQDDLLLTTDIIEKTYVSFYNHNTIYNTKIIEIPKDD